MPDEQGSVDDPRGNGRDPMPKGMSEELGAGPAGFSQCQDAIDSAAVTALLDSIKGAWEGAQEGLADVAAGRVSPIDDL
jgi:hypothetical protein